MPGELKERQVRKTGGERLAQSVRRTLATGFEVTLWAILAAMIFQAVFYSAFIVQRFRREGENCVAECTRVERALAVAKGQRIRIGNAPLMFYPVGFALRALGLEGNRHDRARQAYVAGRSVSLAGTLGILAWLYCMGGMAGLRSVWRFLPVLLFFSGQTIYKHAYCYRPDIPMMALVLWAWAAALWGKGKVSAPAASGLMILAFCYKPTALTSAAILGLWLLVSRDFRRALWYGATYLLPLGAALALVYLYGALDEVTPVLKHVAWMVHAPYWPGTYELLIALWEKKVAVIPLVGGFAACAFFWKCEPPVKGTRLRLRPLQLAFLLSFLVSQLMVLRPGSDVYYYLEPYCWGVLLAAILARRFAAGLRETWRNDRVSLRTIGLRNCIYILLFGLVFLGFAQQSRRLWSEREDLRTVEPWAVRHAELVEILQGITGEILLDEGYPYWFTKAPLPSLMSLGYSTKVTLGLISPAPLISKIENRDFERIILNYDVTRGGIRCQNIEMYPSSINETIAECYDFVNYLCPYYLYRPKPPD